MQGVKYGLTYSSTPVHGYLAVPKFLVERVNFVPSKFSVRINGFWHLEEDMDMPLCLELFDENDIHYFLQYYPRDQSYQDMIDRFHTYID